MSDDFDTCNWTPSALRVLGTARFLATPGKITPEHLLLAMEVTISVARNVFRRLRLQPSEVLRFNFPEGYEPDEQLKTVDFSRELLRAINKQAKAEAKAMGSGYLGTDHLLLMLAAIGVPGVSLNYEQVRQIVLDELDPRRPPR